MRRPVALAPVLLALALLGPARALAQDATPAAGGEALDPAECQAESRSADELIALWYDEAGTPVAAAPGAGTLDSVPVPLGEPADAETVAAVTATVRETLACFNAGDFGRALALFSDELIRSFGPEPGETPEDARGFVEAAPEPVPAADRIRLLAITDVSVMADGRVAAFVVTEDPTIPPEGAETVLLLFAEGEDGRLVDAVVEFVPVEEGGEDEGATEVGTPAP